VRVDGACDQDRLQPDPACNDLVHDLRTRKHQFAPRSLPAHSEDRILTFGDDCAPRLIAAIALLFTVRYPLASLIWWESTSGAIGWWCMWR
jgi:hypothetical protein